MTVSPLLGPDLIKIARRRSGLSQRELAQRMGLPQSSIARWESRARQPTAEHIAEAVRACELDVVVGLAPLDRSNDGFIWELLDLPVERRLKTQVAAANATRRLTKEEVTPFDPVSVIAALVDEGVRFVLVGRLAECLRGSPNLPSDAEVAVSASPEPSNREALARALEHLGARPWQEAEDDPLYGRPLEHAFRWSIDGMGATLASVADPPGTYGPGDLMRGGSEETVAPRLAVDVTSLLDLLRIADASPRPADRLALPSLHRVHELTVGYLPPSERPVTVPEGLEELFAEHGIRPD